MIRISETTRTIPFHRPVPLTSLPLIYHREHLFPYASYGDTEPAAVPRGFRLLVLENDSLRIEVTPELGGRVYSLFDKRIGQEILFRNPVVKPTRILPVWAYISGGIEFNFPIAHSPTSVATVGCTAGTTSDYGFIRVGEREARTGMEWVVELGLVEGRPLLVQRTALRNRTRNDHPWMLWSICAVRATDDTEYVHAPHRVLVHDERVSETDWPGAGLNWERNLGQMTGYFWKGGGSPQFGVFHHELSFGLLHLADAAQLPGKKLWSYGRTKHRAWGEATTEGGLSYSEIEGGPLLDQSEKPLFPSGAERRFEEYWIPVHARESMDQVSWPKLALPPMVEPWLGWQHSAWQTEWEKFRVGEGPLPESTVPTGLDLELPLRRQLEHGDRKAAEPLSLWLVFAGRTREALAIAEMNPHPATRRIAGLILWHGLDQPALAVPHLEAGPLADPIAVVELDQLYAELRLTHQRRALLASAPHHRLVIERRASFALATGDAAEALRLLRETPWPREHQRYVRTELWQRAQAALGQSGGAVPEFLNEDNLAPFGAYWSEMTKPSR